MQIRFGMELDAGCWPEFEAGQQAVIGEVVLGPQGLIGVLQTALGMVAGDEAPQALRIRQYMQRIQSLPEKQRFYSGSFEADAWATARELLAWRDELIMHGWRGDAGDSPERIAALAEIEAVSASLDHGLADHFQMVLQRLQNRPALPLSRVILQESRQLLPAPWRQMFEQLEQCGVAVEEVRHAPVQPKEIVLLESEHIWPLAQSLASWLAATDQPEQVALLCQHDTAQLDQALHVQGLPATGEVTKSAQLGLFQLLPLLLENLWQPVRIERLMELLSVPLSPVPGFAARKLIAAISKEPGLESRLWHSAIEEIARSRAEYLIRDGVREEEAGQQADAFARDLDAWLRISRVDADREASCALVAQRIQRLVEHLGAVVERMPAAKVAMGHWRDMLKVLATMESISRPLLERILDDVIGPGRSAGNLREAAAWGVLNNPAQLVAPVGTLIWWGFTDASAPAKEVWGRQESDWLGGQGVHIDPPQHARERERASWHALLNHCERLLLCRPLELDGQVVPVHPLWFDIQADEALKVISTTRSVLPLLSREAPELMGVRLRNQQAMPTKAMNLSAIRQVNPSADFRPAKLSPSSIGNLLGCSFKWFLEELGIAASDMMAFPEESAMIGTLAHQVLEDVLTAESMALPAGSDQESKRKFAIPTPEQAAELARAQYALRVPQMAADLLLPENRAEYADMMGRMVAAAADVVRRLHEAGFVSVSCEEWIHTQLDGIPVNGRADVIAYDAQGKPHIIDFKYSYSINFYRDKIKKGRDVQLITYARMLGEKQTPVGYYLVPKREMLTNSPAFNADVVDVETPVVDGWDSVRRSVSSVLSQIRRGDVPAFGMLDKETLKQRESECAEMDEIYLDPPCKFCDFKALCGLNMAGEDDA